MQVSCKLSASFLQVWLATLRAMDITIADIHARAAQRLARRDDAPFLLLPVNEEQPASYVPKDQRDIARRALDQLGVAPYSRPLHIRVAEDAFRGKKGDVRQHLSTNRLPEGSFQQLVPQDRSLADWTAGHDLRILVDGPELSALSFAGAVQRLVTSGDSGELARKVVPVARTLGYVGELCGTFARGWDAFQPGETCFELEPIMTLGEFTTFLGKVRNIDGLTVARTVAQWSTERQDSPMEVLLYAMLVMRPGLGGLHLPPPLTNEPLPLKPSERKLITHDTITPDMWWKLYKLILEYDGPYHYEEAGIREDKRRIRDYQTLGYTIFPVAAEDMRSVASFDRFVRPITRVMARVEGRSFARRVDAVLANPDYRARRSLLLSTLNMAD